MVTCLLSVVVKCHGELKLTRTNSSLTLAFFEFVVFNCNSFISFPFTAVNREQCFP